jgi:hypothetical protein
MARWLEIIELRTGSNNTHNLQEVLIKLVKELKTTYDQQDINVYSSFLVGSDFSIHLIHNARKQDVNRSAMGLQIAMTLKEFGLVNHNIWNEISIQIPPKNELK